MLLSPSAYHKSVVGREHERLTLTFLAGSAPFAGVAFSQKPEEAVAAAMAYFMAGAVGILFFSPDLDLFESRSSRRWGMLTRLWNPYRRWHPHRGASHSWVYGPLSRLLYPLFLPALGGMAAGVDVVKVALSWTHDPLFGPALLGYFVSQWAHLVQDRERIRI